MWKGELAPLRAAFSALGPDTDPRTTNRATAFDLAWWSRDFAAAAKVAEESGGDMWTASRGNLALPRRLRLADAYAAAGETAKAKSVYAEVHEQYQAAVKERPDDWDRHVALGLAAAGL